MNRIVSVAMIAVLAGGLGLGSYVLADGEDTGWTITGIGTTTVEAGEDCTVLLSYFWNNPAATWEPEQTWVMTKEADATGTFEIPWDLAGFHGWFLDWVEIYAYADGPEGMTTETLVATPHGEGFPGPLLPGEIDGPFHFSGTVTLTLTDGYDWGFIVTGENFDGGSWLSGTLTTSAPDTTPPTLAPTVNLPALWPPDHEMREVVVQANAEDCCDSLTFAVEITSSEPVNGDDGTSPDWEVISIDHDTGEIILNLRAERDVNGEGDGRVYTIALTAADASGNEATETVEVLVPLPANNGYGPFNRPVFLVFSLPDSDTMDPGTFEGAGKTYFINIGDFIAGQEIPNTRFELLEILAEIELPDGLVLEDLDGSEFTIIGSFNTFSENSIHVVSPSGEPIPPEVQHAFFAASPFLVTMPEFPAPTTAEVAQFVYDTAVGLGMLVEYQDILDYIFIPGQEPLVCTDCQAEGEMFAHDDPTNPLFGYSFVVDEETNEVAVAVRLKVEIDLKPGDDKNIVNYKSKGKVWCAILWTEGFDPLEEVIEDTARLGNSEPFKTKEEDVNDDGNDDLVILFETADIGLTADTETVTLTAETYAGGLIEAIDDVITVPSDKAKK